MSDLNGVRVVVTRPEGRADGLIDSLRALRADVVHAPLIAIEPPGSYGDLDACVSEIGSFDWVLFASANAVRATFERLDVTGSPFEPLRRVRIAAVGPATAAVLRERNLTCDAVPTSATAAALVAAIGRGPGRVLFPRPEEAPEEPERRLTQADWDVSAPAAYRTAAIRPEGRAGEVLAAGRYDAIAFASPSAVASYTSLFAAEVGALIRRRPHPPIVAIGPSTARALEAANLTPARVADPHTDQGIVAALLSLFADQGETIGT